MKDADSVLYRTTYQFSFDKSTQSTSKSFCLDSVTLPKFLYNEAKSPQSKRPPAKSVYESSYLNYKTLNTSAIANPDQHFAITKLLDKSRQNGLTARDIFLGIGKMNGNTSYKRDYPSIAEKYKPLKNKDLRYMPR